MLKEGPLLPIYRSLLLLLLRNYIIGSTIAVLCVGGALIFSTLQIKESELFYVLLTIFISLLVMFCLEYVMFSFHLKPIKSVLYHPNPSIEEIRTAFLQTHKLPNLSIQRIFGPHFLGLSIPAISLTLWFINQGLLTMPYYYVALATIGALLIASMHALIEFFLTTEAIKPVLAHIQNVARQQHGSTISLDGTVIVSIQRKFHLSAFLIGTFPLFLFSLATQIRLLEASNEISANYWSWAGIILLIGLGFSSLGAWLLSRNVEQPIRQLYDDMGKVQEGTLDVAASDIYSDEFSRLITGFNHMVKGLRERELMNNLLMESYLATLAAALDARDPYTAGHSLRVANFSVVIGQAAGLLPQELDLLKKSALLHDIGKIGVRDSVLLKDGKLSDEEFAQIKWHPVLGENILLRIEPPEAMAPLLPGVRSHHERYDGKGYPDGLAGLSIPLFGRIIAVADAFDAMTSDRPYRKGMSVEKALKILHDGKGTQWDPEFAQLFIDFISESGNYKLERIS